MDDATRKEFFTKLDELGGARVIATMDSYKGDEGEAVLEWVIEKKEKKEEFKHKWESIRSWISLSLSFVALIISGLVAYFK